MYKSPFQFRKKFQVKNWNWCVFMSRIAVELYRGKSDPEDLIYSQENGRNKRLEMKDISLDI
jgi:hypothetical protein